MTNRIVIAFITSILLFTSCKKDFEDFEYPDPSDPVNPYKPNGNSQILEQNEFGKTGMKTTFYDMVSSGDADIFFSGLLNNKHTVGKISPEGQLLWTVNLGYVPSGIQNQQDNLLVCGYDMVDDSLSPERAYLQLFNGTDGNIISEQVIDDFRFIRVNGMSDKYIVGRCQTDYSCNIIPFIIEYEIDESYNINILKTKIFESKCNQFFYCIADNFIAGGSGYGRFNDFERYDIKVYSFDTATLHIKWEYDLHENSGFRMQARHLLLNNNQLYLLGFSEADEEVNPANGGYFRDGFVAKFNTHTTSAEFVYKKKHKLSVYCDQYFSGYYDGNFLYGIGRMAAYYLLSTERTFSYGLISKIDPHDGSLLGYKSLGNENHASCFNSFVHINEKDIYGGYTKRYFTGEREAFKGWVPEIIGDYYSANKGEALLNKKALDKNPAPISMLPD